MLKPAASILSLALLAGCSLAPKYERPAAPVTAAYPETKAAAPSSAPTAADIAWQQFFGDARLQRLIALALDNNRDLRVSALNVERVRALYNIQRTAYIPSFNATADGSRRRSPDDLNASGEAQTTNSFEIGVRMPSYELDFFGRVASLRDQVLQQYLATDDARLSARLSLISAVARQYLTLLAADEQLTIARQTSDAAQRSYDLNKQTFDAGVTSELDLRTAEGQLQSVRASLATFQQQRAQAENALALLVGGPLPSDLPPAGNLATQPLIADLPAGLPADLLTRRPDIRAAEHTLQAANANIGIARAAFFPSVKLTAFGGTASAELSGLFKEGSGSWSFAPSITLPIFASGKNKAALEVAKIEKRIEIARYEKTIQTAFREVADALAVRATIDTQIAAQQARVSAAQRRYDLSDQRFQAGVDNFVTVLLAQQELFGAQQSLIQARLARLSNLTALYAALGGGWQDAAPTVATKN
ncbi:multidrug transporter [Nibricoccus aquaticus]|uniref:Multidrug transporter n=1 Tax=Nibricoccus aquaticus TaxID=2576891 RepID=A0A290QAS7_9BACT|nr:efflux transporter outer membrane subunit [Nibricoccus aquaticus]ATC64300.1 multidrug transporter [Nibricoccus aquaticus]